MYYSNKEAFKTAFGIAVLLGFAMAASMIPELRRYFRIRSM